MKKKGLIVLMSVFFLVGMTLVSCDATEETKESTPETEMTESDEMDETTTESEELAQLEGFMCPMDCEDGQTYEEPGRCPVCEMALMKVEDIESEEE